MRHLRHEQGHALRSVGERQAVFHIVTLCVKRENVVVDFLLWDYELVEVPFHAHIENPVYAIDVLVEVQNVAAVGIYEFGKHGKDARLVGAVHQQHGIVMWIFVHRFGFIYFSDAKIVQAERNAKKQLADFFANAEVQPVLWKDSASRAQCKKQLADFFASAEA